MSLSWRQSRLLLQRIHQWSLKGLCSVVTGDLAAGALKNWAATAQCSICCHCNTTSSIHTYCNSWGREVETIRCWDMSEIHKNRSLRMRSWPNTRINLSLSWQCLNFSDTPPQTSGLPALTLRGEKEEEKIHGEVKSEKIIKCMPALTLVFFCTQ